MICRGNFYPTFDVPFTDDDLGLGACAIVNVSEKDVDHTEDDISGNQGVLTLGGNSNGTICSLLN